MGRLTKTGGGFDKVKSTFAINKKKKYIYIGRKQMGKSLLFLSIVLLARVSISNSILMPTKLVKKNFAEHRVYLSI